MTKQTLPRLILCLLMSLIAGPTALAATGEAAQVDPMIFRIAIFILAAFVGYYVVWAVTPALHTPLMSVTNAISAVTVVGAIIATSAMAPAGIEGDAADKATLAKWLGAAAVFFASINIFGGFMVTNRMLAMYKKKERPKCSTEEPKAS